MFRAFTLLAFVISLTPTLISQVVVLTFNGTINGSARPLDSVLVMNLTQGGDTTIYFPNNVLVFGSTHLQDELSDVSMLRSMPNPFMGFNEIMMTTESQGVMNVIVRDATGRVLASQRLLAVPGQHRFQFFSASPGVHFLTVEKDGALRTLRMVATEGAANGNAKLDYLGLSERKPTIKSDRSLFSWESGDELRYIGYATSSGVALSAAIDEAPSSSVTYSFELVNGLVCPNSPTVEDIDGNLYAAVQIGSECWMAENLRTGHYRDGAVIPNVQSDVDWSELSTGAWSNYNNNLGYDGIYGKLYNHYAVADLNLCPFGWHVPSDVEWQQLEGAIGMPVASLGLLDYRGIAQNVGGKLKATTLWNAPNTGASNASGFNALPGGIRATDGGFYNTLDYYGFWWSSTPSSSVTAWMRQLARNNAGILRWDDNTKKGGCVRCLKD